MKETGKVDKKLCRTVIIVAVVFIIFRAAAFILRRMDLSTYQIMFYGEVIFCVCCIIGAGIDHKLHTLRPAKRGIGTALLTSSWFIFTGLFQLLLIGISEESLIPAAVQIRIALFLLRKKKVLSLGQV